MNYQYIIVALSETARVMAEVERIIKILNMNKLEIIAAISTAVSAVSTCIYTGFTLWLVFESRKMRKLQESPQIDIFVERSESWASKLNLIIRNNGFSGAYNIHLTIDKDINILDRNDEWTIGNTGYFKNGIAFLAPQTQRDTLFTVMSTNYKEKITWKIKISAEYKSIYNEVIKRDFIIDLSEFENTVLPDESPIYQISKSFKSIEKDIGHIASGWSKIQVITQTKKEKREEDEERFHRHEEPTKISE